MNLVEEINKIVQEKRKKLFTADDIQRILDERGCEYQQAVFAQGIKELVQRGQLIQTKRGKLGSPEAFGLKLATVKMNERGFGFAKISKEEPDLFIYEGNLGGALDSDVVLVRPFTRRGKKEAEIIKVVKRNTNRFVGIYDGFGRINPDDQKVYIDFKIKRENSLGATRGDKVVVEVTHWNDHKSRPVYAKIVEILGKVGDVGLDILSVAKKFGMESSFPPEVIEEAEALSRDMNSEGREDFRDKVIVTIDGKDAKDLDDAIHIEKNGEGFELGVHIADVSHYVEEGSFLDQEAFNRGTSVYLLDRVIPMLPKRLSNDLCSLNPNEDKLTLSVVMNFDKDGKLLEHRIVDGIIRSSARLNYEEVSDYLEGVSNPYVARIADYYTMLRLMQDLAMKLREIRQRRGAVDFDFPEAKIELAENGVPENIGRNERRIGNMLIEEFMLIANETVAEHYFWLETPFIYRVHESPSSDKLEALKKFLSFLGMSIKTPSNEVHPSEIAKLIESIKGKSQARAISRMALRSMMQARYSSENLGHFGLASKYYCHFTSPIRRYPDLYIHRIIKGEYKSLTELKEHIDQVAEHSSDMEDRAENAERTVESMKMAEYMLFHLGEHFDGTISSVTNFGFFVELDNLVDGLVHISTLDDDEYEFDEELLKLIGRGSRKTYAIGDRVQIEVMDAEPETGKVDFRLVKKL